MVGEPIFDEKYDKPSQTDLPSSQPASSLEEKMDIRIENDPREPVRTVNTGRPYRKNREWTIKHG